MMVRGRQSTHPGRDSPYRVEQLILCKYSYRSEPDSQGRLHGMTIIDRYQPREVSGDSLPVYLSVLQFVYLVKEGFPLQPV
jgi:hypothetical protein